MHPFRKIAHPHAIITEKLVCKIRLKLVFEKYTKYLRLS